MPAQREFDFPISTLIRDAKLLLGALRDDQVGPPVATRLVKKDPAAPKFDADFAAQIQRVEKGGTDQSTAVGSLGTLTEAETTAYHEMERLISGARRSGGLAFPGQDTRLHSEFQVGINSPQDLASELERAGKILTACGTHADALAEHGWIAADTQLLAEAIGVLSGGDTEQEDARGKKKGITKARNLGANLLYKMCLTVQNATRLAFPSTKAASDEKVVEARTRYLLEVFPPRSGASAGDKPTPTGTPPTEPAK